MKLYEKRFTEIPECGNIRLTQKKHTDILRGIKRFLIISLTFASFCGFMGISASGNFTPERIIWMIVCAVWCGLVVVANWEELIG